MDERESENKMKSENIELKKCPFCGSEASLKPLELFIDTLYDAKVGCDKCKIYFYGNPDHMIYGWPTEEDVEEANRIAIDLWNRRSGENAKSKKNKN